MENHDRAEHAAWVPNSMKSVVPGYSGDWNEEPSLDSGDLATASPAFEPTPSAVLTESELPESRIRFTAPAELRIEGNEDSVPAAVLNLSRGGVALVGDCELTPGQRIWARFRLGLTDEPVDYLCAVAWRKCDGQQNLYGCEFSSLAEDEFRELDRLVDARTQGLETEWSIPGPIEVFPQSGPTVVAGAASQPATPKKGWISSKRAFWAAFVLLGVALAINAVGARTDATSAQTTQTKVPGTAAGVGMAADELNPPIRVATGEEASESVNRDGDTQPVAAAEPSVTGTGTSDVSRVPGTRAGTRARALDAAESTGGDDAGSELLSDTPRGVEIELRAGGSVESYTSFWLENPRRFVVDVQGQHSNVENMHRSFTHPLISRLRVGRHPNKVRFVLEVANEVSEAQEARMQGNSLWIELLRSGD